MSVGRKNKKTLGYGNVQLLFEACRGLDESGAKYLIVGGVASNLHGIARSTKDIDILIPKDAGNTQKILGALSRMTLGLAKEISVEEVLGKPFTIIGDLPRVDLLIRAGKIRFEEAYPRRKVITLDGVRFPIVSIDDLIRSKDTGRPHDVIEIEELKAIKKLHLRKK